MMAALKIAKCDGPFTQPPTERERALQAPAPIRLFTSLHAQLQRLGLAPRRCRCAARATRLDAALNRLLTRLQRRF